MRAYWCRLYYRRGNVVAAEEIRADDDHMAVSKATTLLTSVVPSFVLMEGRRIVAIRARPDQVGSAT